MGILGQGAPKGWSLPLSTSLLCGLFPGCLKCCRASLYQCPPANPFSGSVFPVFSGISAARSCHLGRCLLIQRYFCPGLWLCRKCRSWQVSLKSKKKIGGNHAFFQDNSWIIFVKALKYKACMAFFSKLKLNYLSKMHGYPQFSFWILRLLTKIYFIRIVLNRAKISLY